MKNVGKGSIKKVLGVREIKDYHWGVNRDWNGEEKRGKPNSRESREYI